MIHQQLQNQNRLCVQDQSLPELITSWDEMCLWENIEFIIYLATSSASTAFILFNNFIMVPLDKSNWSKNYGKNLCKCVLNPIRIWWWITKSRFEISLLVEWWLRRGGSLFILFANFIVIMVDLDKCKWSKNVFLTPSTAAGDLKSPFWLNGGCDAVAAFSYFLPISLSLWWIWITANDLRMCF